MKKILPALALISTCHIVCFPAFDTAMGKNHPHYASYFDTAKQDQEAYDLLAQQYARTMRIPTTSDAVRIPKIIHHIWLGSAIPESYQHYIQSWRTHHPDWEHILWDDASIQELNLENKDLYDAAINYGERSDIARYEILYRFGGLYVDTDFACIQAFDALHYTFDLYVGIELPGMALFLGRSIMIANSLIACTPGHTMMRACIDTLRTQQHINDIVKRSGPIFFTNVFLAHAGSLTSFDIALPALYFYPLDKNTKDPHVIQKCVQPYTYAIHYWAGSWILKQEAFVPGITLTSQQEGNTLRFRIIDRRK